MPELEHRYLVLKLSHVEKLEGSAIKQLLDWLTEQKDKMPKLDCVVLEKDWATYDLTKSLVLGEGEAGPVERGTLLKALEALARVSDPVALAGIVNLCGELRKTTEQLAEDAMDDPEEQLNCAEAVLDSYAAQLNLEQTSFDCVGDYITAVVKAVKRAGAK